MGDLGAELVEVLPLRSLQPCCDAVQGLVLRCIGAEIGGRGFPVGIAAGPTGAIALRPEAAEPDAGILTRAPADQADSAGVQADAEDFRDALEIFIDGVEPVMVEAALAIPARAWSFAPSGSSFRG
jgi:hypothetical protein